MTLGLDRKNKQFSDLVRGTLLGFGLGLALTVECWLAAGLIKLLLTWDTGIWPAWFPGHIPDFILSGWWLVIIAVPFTAAGALVGYYWPGYLEVP